MTFFALDRDHCVGRESLEGLLLLLYPYGVLRMGGGSNLSVALIEYSAAAHLAAAQSVLVLSHWVPRECRISMVATVRCHS